MGLLIDEEILKYEDIGGVNPQQEAPVNPNVNIAKGKFSLLKLKLTSLNECATTVKETISDVSEDEEIPKAKYVHFTESLDDVKKEMEQLEELLAEIVTLNPAEAENYATHFGTEIAKVKKLHADCGKVMA